MITVGFTTNVLTRWELDREAAKIALLFDDPGGTLADAFLDLRELHSSNGLRP